MKYLIRIKTIILSLFLTSCLSMGGYLETKYVDIAESVLPSVVEVIAIGLKEDSSDTWFDYFQDQEENRREKFDTSGIGSGVIVESDNNDYFIITNNHVVGDLDEVIIILNDKSKFTGTVVGIDVRFDLAVIRITSDKALPVAKINHNNDLKVGQFVGVLGSPMGYVQSISMGVISNIGRYGGPKGNVSNFIQTDASINQGNSGGPLVNLRGEVIGINTWISSPSGGSVGLGFAVPILNIYPSFRSIVDNGEIKKSWIGISTGQIPRTEYYENIKGAFVYQVVLDSPAYKMNLMPGDVIVGLNNNRVNSPQDLILMLSLLKPSDKIQLTVERAGNNIVANLTLDEADDDVLETSKKVTPGLILREDENGVILLEVLSKSVGQASGFQKNDRILKLNNRDINKIHNLYEEIKKGLNKVLITREEKELELEFNY